jgi:hypothetical protein
VHEHVTLAPLSVIYIAAIGFGFCSCASPLASTQQSVGRRAPRHVASSSLHYLALYALIATTSLSYVTTPSLHPVAPHVRPHRTVTGTCEGSR